MSAAKLSPSGMIRRPKKPASRFLSVSETVSYRMPMRKGETETEARARFLELEPAARDAFAESVTERYTEIVRERGAQ